MILLDTNVVSESMRPRPDPHVMDWLNSTETASLYVSSITVAEIEYGLHLLSAGRRRTDLESRFRRFIGEGFENRVMVFDVAAAVEYGMIMALRRSAGQPMASLDGRIAAIARSRGLVLATRNMVDVEDCGVVIVNPFLPG